MRLLLQHVGFRPQDNGRLDWSMVGNIIAGGMNDGADKGGGRVGRRGGGLLGEGTTSLEV